MYNSCLPVVVAGRNPSQRGRTRRDAKIVFPSPTRAESHIHRCHVCNELWNHRGDWPTTKREGKCNGLFYCICSFCEHTIWKHATYTQILGREGHVFDSLSRPDD